MDKRERKEKIMSMVRDFNVMNPDDHLNRAILLGTLVHTVDKDKAGAPYILHIIRVIAGCKTLEGKVVAGLHDVVEDHPEFTFDDLRSLGFTEYQVQGVDNITKRDKEPKSEYLVRVGSQENSTDAKKSDLTDNMNLSRLPVITESDMQRNKDYAVSLATLESIVFD